MVLPRGIEPLSDGLKNRYPEPLDDGSIIYLRKVIVLPKYIMKRKITQVTRNCKICDKPFLVLTKELKRGFGIFCSRSCSAKNIKRFKPKPPNCKCSNCKIEFYRSQSKMKLSKSGHQFCSRECKDTAQRIGGIREIQPDHYGTASIVKYREKAFRYYEKKCISCGYNKHPNVLEVHHIDRNRENNDLSNLIPLCPTCHTEVHRGHRVVDPERIELSTFSLQD